MSRDLNDLEPGFRTQVEQLLAACQARSTNLRPFFTLRSAQNQAELWRQSRAAEEINAKIADLEAKGAPFIASVIRDVGPRNGNHVTNAIPGLSWHQWGEAVDCFWQVDGKAIWSPAKKVNGQNGYHVYADEAARMGLTAGGNWKRLKDWPHVQLRAESSPAKLFSLEAIDSEMRGRFGS